MAAAIPMTLSCPHCAAQMPESAAYCPGCGRPMRTPVRALERVGLLTENSAGVLAYFTFISAIALLRREPYKRNRFVRLQCFQCLWLTLACLAIGAALKLASLILFLIPVVGPLFISLVAILGCLAAFVLWLVLVVKAFQGEVFLLPIVGGLAEQLACAMPREGS